MTYLQAQEQHYCAAKSIVDINLNDFLDVVMNGVINDHCDYGEVKVNSVVYNCVQTFKEGVAWKLQLQDPDPEIAEFVVLKSAGDPEIAEWNELNSGGKTSQYVCSMQFQEADIVVSKKDGGPADPIQNKFIILDFVPGDTMAAVAKGASIEWNSGDLKRCLRGIIEAIDFTKKQTGGVPDDNHWENMITSIGPAGRQCKLIDVAGNPGGAFDYALTSFKAPASTGHKSFCSVLEQLKMDATDLTSENMKNGIVAFWCKGVDHLKDVCGEDNVREFNYKECWKVFEGESVGDEETSPGRFASESKSDPIEVLNKVNTVLNKEMDYLLRGNRR